MKKSSFFILLSMMALTCEFGLTACSSANEEVVDNPNYDPVTKTVNANFVFSVSTGNTSSAITRQSSSTAQATLSERFRGIDAAQLHAFKLSANGSYVTSAMSATKGYDLGAILDPGRLDPDGSGLNANGDGVPLSHQVIQLALPTETNALMFWGKAYKDDVSSESGEIDFDASSTDISRHYFSLTPRIPKSGTSPYGQDAFLQYQSLILYALNTIAQTKIADVDVTVGSTDKHITSLGWSDYADLTASPIIQKATDPFDASGMSSNGDVLGYVFSVFHNIKAGEIRGGYGFAIAYMMSDIYDAITPVVESSPASAKEAAARLVAIEIQNNIKRFFNLNTPATWLSVDQIIANTGISAASVNLVRSGGGDLNAFPSNFNVPAGVSQLVFAPSSCEWRYDEKAYSLIGTGSATVFDYMYPAELCYFGNSPIRVTDASKTPGQYPDGVAAWDNDGSWSGWTKDGSVQSTTHSVAMRDNINYGTALLESTVRYGSSILEDNNHALQKANNPYLADDEEPNNEIEVNSTSFQLKGIIIGGQPQTVGWNYLAKDGTTSSFNYMIYDNSLPDATIPTYTASGNKSVPNYTLVWDNWSEAQRNQDQSVVYVALEFLNNTGRDFFGRDNKIPAGGTFYIAGKLDPDAKSGTVGDVTDMAYKSDKSLGITWPTKYALPPYDADGNTLKQRRVFMQDYMTVANFILNRYSLQNAYVTVPDLRSLQISLGMSVDLEWQTGLTFEVILGQ